MLRITQNAIEVARKPSNADICVSQIAAEIIRSPSSRYARTSQLVVEVLRANATPPAEDEIQQPLAIIVAG